MTDQEIAEARGVLTEIQILLPNMPHTAAQIRRADHALRCVRLFERVLLLAERAYKDNDFTRDGGVLLPDEFKSALDDALLIYRRGPS